MKKRSILLLILSILLILIPFIISAYSILRLISIIMGIILFSITLLSKKSKFRIIKIIMFSLILSGFIYYIDYFNLKIFNNIPIISIKYESSKKMKTYNSFGYRVFDCNNDLIIDNNYKKNYVCNNSLIKSTDINKFITGSYDNYLKYKNKFVHIKGKISTIIGSSSLYLSYYEISDTTLNGFVNFDNNKKLVIDNVKINPKDYYIYDNVEVIGLVNTYKSNKDGYEIHLTNAKIIKSDIYKDYEITVNTLNDQTYTKKKDNIYYVGIEGIYYKYDKDVIYELSYLINDERENINNLILDKEEKIINEKDIIYYLNDYNIIKCENNIYLFLNKNIYNLKNICNIEN